jgi:hypothetical protein
MYAKHRTRRTWEKLQAYLKLYQILLDGDRTSLVDLDNFAAADPVLDVANVGPYDAGDLS